ncbi:FMRFamide receptor [Clonorchis sinensis]|uniref:FMRFamide receptor n=1 Tax=Clonorchis sinensis TaxID=79923 RepID=A0A419PRR0_CLOSI|nr:FMRFamide receptor [Clonorchis sinensis]
MLRVVFLLFLTNVSTYAISCFNATHADLISLQKTYTLVRITCTQFLSPIVCITGIFTNILNIAVLARPRMRSTTNIYLLALAVCDLLYGLIVLIISFRIYTIFGHSYTYMRLFPYLIATGDLCSHTASWLTCSFTVERFIAISSPILARRVCTPERCKCIIIVLCLCNILVNIPEMFSRVMRNTQKSNSTWLGVDVDKYVTNSTSYQETEMQHSAIVRHESYELILTSLTEWLRKIGWPVILVVLEVILPLLILIIFNALLIRFVVQRSFVQATLQTSIQRKHSDVALSTREISCTNEHPCTPHSGGSSRTKRFMEQHDCGIDRQNVWPHHNIELFGERSPDRKPTVKLSHFQQGHTAGLVVHSSVSERHRITIMLIAVVLAYIVFTLPSVMLYLVHETYPCRTTEYVQIQLRVAGNLINLGLVINSSLNFFLYSLLSRRFRTTFHTLLRCKY